MAIIIRLMFWFAIVALPGALTIWGFTFMWRRLGSRMTRRNCTMEHSIFEAKSP
jgi:hypothetical protein